MIIRAADKDLLPRLGMGRAARSWRSANSSIFSGVRPARRCRVRSLRSASRRPLTPFEVLEKQNEPLEVRGLELAIDAVKRMGDGVGDRLVSGDSLADRKCCRAARNLGVLRFGNAPDEQMNFTWILRKISRNLLADERIANSAIARQPRSCRDP